MGIVKDVCKGNDEDFTAVTTGTESTDDPAILKQKKMMASFSSSPSSAHLVAGNDVRITGGDVSMPMPLREEELSSAARRRLRCCFCSCWLLAMAMAGLTAYFALGLNKRAKNDASASSRTAPPQVMLDPQEKMNFVLQAILGNNITRSYAELFPENTKDLKGKAQDADAHPMIRAMSWLVHEDAYDYTSELVQRFALATIYYTSEGESWTNNKNWLSTDKSICSGWFGVTCCGQFYNDVTLNCANRSPKEIAELDLHENNVRGTISDAFALLTELNVIWLDSNQLTGPLRGDLFGKFPYLTELYVQHNHLSGPIEESLRDSKVLQTLYLQGNEFEGETPAQFCRGCGSSSQSCVEEFVAFGFDCNRNQCPEDCCKDGADGFSRFIHCYNSD
jgi:Leucine rich repeat